VLALNATLGGEPAVAAAKSAGEGRKVSVATFDITAPMLTAVAAGEASFAIDQQPFLQGYLPVQYLALLIRRQVVPVSNVSTGPRLIEAEEARRRLGPAAIPAEPAEATEPPTEGEATEPAGESGAEGETAEPGGG